MPDLTNKAVVKAALGITGTAADAKIDAAIAAASAAITAEYEREFTPTASATRRFAVAEDGWVDLTPYDLRTITAVVLDPDGAAITLNPGDYQTHPFPARDGVYTAIELLTTTRPAVTGRLVVSIDGAWGFASVPDAVVRAVIETVRANTRSDPNSWGATAPGDGRETAPMPQGTYAIPAAARRWLDPYRRYGVIG